MSNISVGTQLATQDFVGVQVLFLIILIVILLWITLYENPQLR